MLKLFVKDNFSGTVHEYGTDPHDALILMDDGSLHYEHLQCGVGTMFPDEGFSFCNEDGSIPACTEEVPYLNIGGEFYKKPQTSADCIRAMSDEELAVFLLNFFVEHMDLNGIPHEEVTESDRIELLRQLKQPAEE